MGNLADLAKQRRFRGMIAGYPGSAKTGCLAPLANAGYNLRILDYDNNLDPLFEYVKPENYGNVEVVTLEDKMRMGPDGPEPMGKPTAYDKGLRLLEQWKYQKADGSEVDLGLVSSWGEKDVLVLDSATGMGRAAFRRVLHLNGRTMKNRRRQDWGSAMADQEAFIEKLTAANVKCHVVVIAHLKPIGPKIGGDNVDEDDEVAAAIKEQQMRVAELVPTKLFPAFIGQALPPTVAEHFPILLRADTKFTNGKKRRVLITEPQPEMDLKISLAGLPNELPVEDGLLKIFNRLVTPDGAKEAA